jgi:hypothetical protein
MTVLESHFQVDKMQKIPRHGVSNPGEKDFTTRQESHFQAAKMMKSCSPEVMYSSAKILMTLE